MLDASRRGPLVAALLLAGACRARPHGDGAPDPSARPTAPAVPIDLPKAASSGEIAVVFEVTLAADGRTFVDGKEVLGDDELLLLGRTAAAKHPDLRALISADRAVTHGRVIHALDLLKQAGISKIAFAVEAVPPPAPSR